MLVSPKKKNEQFGRYSLKDKSGWSPGTPAEITNPFFPTHRVLS